jgi:hypothetical protein
MIVERELAIQLDVMNPISICIGNYEENIKKKLEEIYVNKCYKNMLITNIKKIIAYTQPIMSRSNIDGLAHICIRFIAEGIDISQNDVIIDTVIKEISSKDIIVEKGKINGILQRINFLSSFSVGDNIPVMIDAVMYTVGKQSINTKCKVYLFVKRMRDIRKSGDYDKTFYDKLFTNIQNVKNNIMKYDKTLINTILRLLQCGMNVVGNTIPELPAVTESCLDISNDVKNIKDIHSFIENKIVSTHSIDNNLNYIISYKESIPDNNITIINSESCLHQLLGEYLIFLKVLNDFLEKFQHKDFNDYKKLWYLYYKVNNSK